MKTDERRLGWAAAGVAAAGALGAAYAFLVEPRWLGGTRAKIHARGLHPALEGFRIALLTDMHAGAGTPMSVIRRACRAAMGERPHLVALTGDFAADDAPGFRGVLDALACLDAPYGVWAVPGNHDHIVGIEKWHRDVAAHPVVRDLTNRAEVLDVDGARFCVAGVDDFTAGDPSLEALPPPEERDFTLLLAHDPDQAERARRGYDAVDLIVSGHTHGGQVRLPLLGPLKTQNPLSHRMAAGLFDPKGLKRAIGRDVGGRLVTYISRGIGVAPLWKFRTIKPRLLCRPEVALLTLHQKLSNSPPG